MAVGREINSWQFVDVFRVAIAAKITGIGILANQWYADNDIHCAW